MKLLLQCLIWYFISSHSHAKSIVRPLPLDTTKSVPKSIRIFTNLYLPTQLFFSDKFKSGEASLELWQKHGKAWVGEIGYASRTRNNGDYRLRGSYLRLGYEIGFWEKQPARRALGAWQMGLRVCGSVAQSKIKSDLNIVEPYWGKVTFMEEVRGIFSLWAEAHISLRARIGKRFLMGPMLKAKLLLLTPQSIFGNNPPEIVGFGVRRGIQGEAGYWVGFLLDR